MAGQILCCLQLLICPSVRAFQPDPVVVNTHAGKVSGVLLSGSKVVSFKGIPYAAPPVGNLRWQAPRPPVPWSGIKKCEAFSASPMQPTPKPFFVIGPEFTVPEQPLSEDCLYLNIWTGSTGPKQKKPVLVWIYGGGFFSGGAAAPGYDGEAMAKKGVVFVSFNYRIGIFGFFSHPDLSKESGHGSGNYGLLDQLALLHWIKENIAAFGGDPDNVCIAGQSAGSVSVNCLIASPLSKGLFRRAIAESGNLLLPNPIMNTPILAQAESQGIKKVFAITGDSSIASLRKLSAAELQAKTGGFYGPVIDGYLLETTVADVYVQGKQQPVALLMGWNADEGFVFSIPKKKDFLKTAAGFGADSSYFLTLYPAGSDEEAALSQVALNRDEMVGVSSYLWAKKQNEKNHTDSTYVYNFLRKPPSTGKSAVYGAYHTAEIGYALDNLSKINRPWTAVDDSLAAQMSAYWCNFARTGNPNGAGLPRWPAFTDDRAETMIFDDQVSAVPLPSKPALEFLLKRYPNKNPGL